MPSNYCAIFLIYQRVAFTLYGITALHGERIALLNVLNKGHKVHFGGTLASIRFYFLKRVKR